MPAAATAPRPLQVLTFSCPRGRSLVKLIFKATAPVCNSLMHCSLIFGIFLGVIDFMRPFEESLISWHLSQEMSMSQSAYLAPV